MEPVEAAAIASPDGDGDVTDIEDVMKEKHCAVFLSRAFGINPFGNLIEQQGGTTNLKQKRAVVTVKVDGRAVSHPYGIVGVIYKLKDCGGALIVCDGGLLCHGTSHTSWSVSADMYSLKYKADDMTNFPDVLEGIKAAIMDGTFDEKGATPITIQ